MLKDLLIQKIRNVSDFPKPGVSFKDITPILKDHSLTKQVVDEMCKTHKNDTIDAIAGIESRGFWFGIMLANQLGLPFIPIRKKGKLPYKTVSYSYESEYALTEIEMHEDAVKENWNVLIHDDLLATGGTTQAAAELILKQGAAVAGFSFIVELNSFNGRKKLLEYSKNISHLVCL